MEEIITSQTTNPPKLNPPISRVLLIAGFIFLMIVVCVTMFFLGKSASKNTSSSSNRHTQHSRSSTPAKNIPYDLYYVKDDMLYGANVSDADGTYIGEKAILVHAAQDGTLGLLDEDYQYVEVDGTGKQLQSLQFTPFKWSNNGKYALGSEEVNEFGVAKGPISLFDLQENKKIKQLPNHNTTQILGIQNDGTVLLYDILENRTMSGNNIQLSKLPLEATSKMPFVQIGFSSMPSKLSPDTSLLAYSGSDNDVHILDLRTKEVKTPTSFDELNGERAWNVYWSPKGDKLAFQTFGNFKEGDRIGILDIHTNAIYYLTENEIVKLLPHPDSEAEDIFVSEYVPMGWDKTGEFLITYFAGTREYKDGRIEEIKKYWAYSLRGKSYAPIDFLTGIQHPTFPH